MNDYSKLANNFFEQKTCNTPQEVFEAQKNYKDFVRQINKSDFCNTSRRYIAELHYARKLIELYSKYNYTQLQDEMTKREAEILKKLKDEFGITYNG